MGDLLSVDNYNNNLVQNLVDNFRDAFNSHDPKMLSSLLIEDGEWTDVIGHTMIGRNEIQNQHVYPFTTVLKEAKPDDMEHCKKERYTAIEDNTNGKILTSK
jgi:uncharacterized protein (TIGR02246 family)